MSELVPFLYCLLNASLSAGVVPAAFKSVYICPLLKKADLDTTDIKNYRPISNLTVLSKLLEKLVARQLIDYLSVNKLLPDRQSAYRAFRSTETAIAGLMPDILLALDAGDIAALALLDLSAAFDTVDHTILIQRLRTSFGLNDAVLSWFRSYLDQRRQHVCHRGEQSAPSIVQFGVPQGSVLGPLLFVMYTADVVNMVERQGLSAHQYASGRETPCRDITVSETVCWSRKC